MRFSPAFLDEIRARLPVSQVVARKVQLKRKGREFAGLSPFKDEKTPSFFVNDQKGFYHCFASGEHGDIFKFLMETEGLSFPEAVERLAGEAGVPMPAPEERTPEMERRQDERTRLYALLEAAAAYFERQLSAGHGRDARAYLDKRGLRRETIGKFRIGYAPNSKTALKAHLAGAGFTEDEMGLSGMAIHGEDIRIPYDRFRNRIMFPITDPKGRVIAFGGRALDANVPAKYLNSPETPLFHKGNVLFNAANARQSAYEREQIIVVEGYMDVVALAEGGFANAVAPLGTALTEDQIKLLWRMASEPLLCFDGDGAGRKAAFRAVDTALPLLQPGTSLAFAFLPDGLDPDDLLRQQGADALGAVLARARPLADVLWEREWGDGRWQTPERRAQLEQQVFKLVAGIADPAVRGHYERAMRDRLFGAWRAANTSGQNAGNGHGQNYGKGYRQGAVGRAKLPWQGARGAGGRAWQGGRTGNGNHFAAAAGQPVLASASLKRSRIVSGTSAEPSSREALLICALLNHPWLIDDHCETISSLDFTSNALERLRDGILSAHALNNPLDRAALRHQLTRLGLDKNLVMAERALTHRCDKFAEPETDRADVEIGWLHAMELHIKQLGLKQALDAAQRAWDEDGDESAQARIFELKQRLSANIEIGPAADVVIGDGTSMGDGSTPGTGLPSPDDGSAP